MKKIAVSVLVLLVALLALTLRRRVERYEDRRAEICVCMLYTKDIAGYAALTEKINRAYAARHGYDFIVFRDRLAKDRAAQWDKVKAVEACFDAGYEFVFWIDADAFFNVHELALETFIDDDHDLFICDDMANSAGLNDCWVNTGTMLLRNTEFSRALLKRWWNTERSDLLYGRYHEQTVLDQLIKTDPDVAIGVRIYPAKAFNSVGPELKNPKTDWRETFVIHMMSNGPSFRRTMSLHWLKDHGLL